MDGNKATECAALIISLGDWASLSNEAECYELRLWNSHSQRIGSEAEPSVVYLALPVPEDVGMLNVVGRGGGRGESIEFGIIGHIVIVVAHASCTSTPFWEEVIGLSPRSVKDY